MGSAKRKPTPKKTRFDIFKRDGFKCQYCGKFPPAVVLEIDHILAVANGGSDDEDNLLTACFDCNRGKAAGMLEDVPPTVGLKAELLAERALQLQHYNKLLAAEKRRRMKVVDFVATEFRKYFPDRSLTESFRTDVFTCFTTKLTKSELAEAMEIAARKYADEPSVCIKYFCGICWRTIKGDRPARKW